ncbi:FecCD family ABC transporter permease [Anaerosinus massiliensis]|uniref:FecCD family ABC transporter permease n=1 Tax=Massilibacillus massiliensis TaxID=1806837 RepID=UPI000AFAFAA8|nr:iron ABC transporter permease [Massilibacillus massiliensis]
MPKGLNHVRIFVLLVLLFFYVIFVSLAYGQIDIPVQTVLAIIAQQLHIPGFEHISITQEQTAVIWHIRMPRTLVGILVGAAFAVAGAVMQGVFGNPLADPGILGVSSGAGLGAVLAIATGFSTLSMFYMPLFALLGAAFAVTVTVSLAMRQNKISVMTLLLAGVAISIFLGALTSGILTFISEYKLREFLFWTVGGLDYRRWEHVAMGCIPILAGVSILCILARQLNILVLGEEEAYSVGMSVAKLRLFLLALATLTTAAAVCISGNIGFVGLIVPHVMRLLLGPEHRTLLPASALAGGIFLVACDTVGRFILPPAEVRVGIMTALIGAPYFLYLLRRLQKGGLF